MNKINQKIIELTFIKEPEKVKQQIELINPICQAEITEDSILWIKNNLTDFTGGYDIASVDPISKAVILAMALTHPSLWIYFCSDLVNDTSKEWAKKSKKIK
jgi:hypothetical protein